MKTRCVSLFQLCISYSQLNSKLRKLSYHQHT
nr:MAG TPA: hypothetical protein [Caudoviricetes sp.]